jgi:hypothetical protein
VAAEAVVAEAVVAEAVVADIEGQSGPCLHVRSSPWVGITDCPPEGRLWWAQSLNRGISTWSCAHSGRMCLKR